MQWLLHLISVNPDAQTELQEAADRTHEGGAVSCPLLKGALKESMRLYPVAPFITRYMPDDIVIDGYDIKAGVKQRTALFFQASYIWRIT